MAVPKLAILILIVLACVITAPAMAGPCATATCHGAPAPLIGFGLGAPLAVGGVWICSKFLKRRRRS
jgi:hypothetical protein